MSKVLEGKVVAVDFDGTIVGYTGWKGVGVFGKVLDGAKWALDQMKKEGATIIINTCRREVDIVNSYLIDNEIEFDYINFNPENKKLKLSDSKVKADFYIDDKGISFRGDWRETYLSLINFKTHWERDGSAISSDTV